MMRYLFTKHENIRKNFDDWTIFVYAFFSSKIKHTNNSERIKIINNALHKREQYTYFEQIVVKHRTKIIDFFSLVSQSYWLLYFYVSFLLATSDILTESVTH